METLIQNRVQQLLLKKFTDYKVKNPNFSIRSLATKLEMQPSATNEIMKGQRRVSIKIAQKIADKLQLDPSERTDLLKDFPTTLSKAPRKNEMMALKLSADQFELIADSIHFAILSLIKTKNFKSDMSWMAKRLGVTELDVRKAVIRLQQLNLIHIGEKGAISRTDQPIRTTDDITNLSLQRMHSNDLEISRKKLSSIPVDKRDYSNFTFVANPQNLKRAKEILRRAQDEIEEIMKDSDADEVYRVCMHLFPLTELQEGQK